jgi:hypothetical protein
MPNLIITVEAYRFTHPLWYLLRSELDSWGRHKPLVVFPTDHECYDVSADN